MFLSKVKLHIILIFVVFLFVENVFAEILSVGVATWFISGAVFTGGGWYSWDKIKHNTYCRFAECCTDEYVPYNLDSKHELWYNI